MKKQGELTRSVKRRFPGGKVLCTALAVTMMLTTTASATTKPWWLSKYRVTFDNGLGIVGNVTLTFASDGGSFIRPITKRYGESISLESYVPNKEKGILIFGKNILRESKNVLVELFSTGEIDRIDEIK